MKAISIDTRISDLIKANPDVIDAIASINPLFRKLKNPVLRRVLARRVTISEAAKIGKCSLATFAAKLRPMGFNLPYPAYDTDEIPYVDDAESAYDDVLDVRETIKENKDPFQDIIKVLLNLRDGGTLLLVNSFVPFPLIKILKSKGYTVSVTHPDDKVVYTYLTKATNETIQVDNNLINEIEFDKVAALYVTNLVVTDVRQMQMPGPMQHILGKLQDLQSSYALYVYHKKIPMFLLPELTSIGYKYVFKEEKDAILMIIYKPEQQ